MKINNKYFYFDYKNGKYGYNTSSSRGADTFSPFKKGALAQLVTVTTSHTYEAASVNITVYANTVDAETNPVSTGAGSILFTGSGSGGNWAMNVNYSRSFAIGDSTATINVRTGSTYYVYYTLSLNGYSSNISMHCGNSNLSYAYTVSGTFIAVA